MEITVQKLSEEEIDQKGIRNWPIWQKEASEFPWHYDDTEECLLLEGKVEVKVEGQVVSFGAGDFVTFPKGLSCEWKILEDVRKYYNFI